MVKSRYLQLLFVLELPPLSLSFSVRPFMFPHSLLPSHAPPSFPVSTKSHRAKLTAAQNPRGLDQGQWFPGHGRSWTKMITPRALIGRWGSQGTGSDESRGRAFMAITRLSAISLPPSPFPSSPPPLHLLCSPFLCLFFTFLLFIPSSLF